MSDWNEQAAPNNNLTSSTIRTSNLVGKQGQQTAGVDNKVTEEEPMDGKDREYLDTHLKSRQPGM